ncbi:hypothetical protein [Aureivirga sp. CE67]|uniref:hypothetical protein n=1 Tax=Aureivirga sp. CE67 TaxID=1788983 RepID=UPI0018CBDC2D|nr:hypothetical protein [Aureivirga sp. CE67]
MKYFYSFLLVLILPIVASAQVVPPPTPPDDYPSPIVNPPHLPIDSNIIMLVIAAVGLGVYTIYKKKLKLQ